MAGVVRLSETSVNAESDATPVYTTQTTFPGDTSVVKEDLSWDYQIFPEMDPQNNDQICDIELSLQVMPTMFRQLKVQSSVVD